AVMQTVIRWMLTHTGTNNRLKLIQEESEMKGMMTGEIFTGRAGKKCGASPQRPPPSRKNNANAVF
uniref:hypothetical protein n=1 Tax=Xenorhabdus sp. PB30.3 TaxID=2788941 RepID=UPI001E49D770